MYPGIPTSRDEMSRDEARFPTYLLPPINSVLFTISWCIPPIWSFSENEILSIYRDLSVHLLALQEIPPLSKKLDVFLPYDWDAQVGLSVWCIPSGGITNDIRKLSCLCDATLLGGSRTTYPNWIVCVMRPFWGDHERHTQIGLSV